MPEEDYLTPIAGQLVAGVIIIAGAIVASRLMNCYVDRKLRKMDRERLLNIEIPAP